MTCPICHHQEAVKHPAYGILPCLTCQERHGQGEHPAIPVEFTSADIQDQRKAHLKSIIQPWRSGELSREYLEINGRKSIAVTDEQAAKARYVWNDLPNVQNLRKTR